MLIIGAKGFAVEVLEVFYQNAQTDILAFYDDINGGDLLFNKYPILSNIEQVKDFFLNFNPAFTLGIGKPDLRAKMYKKFINVGGEFTSTISKNAKIGTHNVNIGEGANILTNAVISSNVSIGKGLIAYYNVVITHDCFLGDFVEISPNAQLLGKCRIGSMTHIGANTTILPNLTVGDNVVIGAGSVVTKNLPSNCVAIGSPAKIIRYI